MDDQNTSENSTSTLNKVFNLLGWISFVFMVPPVLGLLGINTVTEFLSKVLGPWGSTESMIIYFLGFQLLRVFFGSGRIITPLIMAFLAAGFQLCAIFPVFFMSWLYRVLEPSHYYAGKAPAAIISLLFLALSYFLSSARRIPFVLQFLILVILPVGGIIALEVTGLNQQILAFLGSGK